MNSLTQNLHLKNYKKEYGVYKYDDMKIQIIKECAGKNHLDAHNIYNNIRVFNNRNQDWDDTLHEFKE
jgi:hypothetical protein